MNKIYYMGIEITSNLPTEILQDVMNLAQKDPDVYLKLAQWHTTELPRQMKKHSENIETVV